MVPECPEPEIVPAVSRQGARLWVQILLVILLAVLAQAIGLGFAYVSRCKPGQGNDWCGAGSLAGVLLGFAAAVCILVAGSITIILRRRSRRGGGGGKVGVLRVLAVALGVVLVLYCGWMLGIGWMRTHTDPGLWFGLVLGLALIAVAFVRRHRA